MQYPETISECPEMFDPEQFQALLGLIYDAALQPGLWPSVVSRVRQLLGGSAGLLFTPQQMDGPLAMTVPENIAPEVMRQYAETYHRHDVWTQAGIERSLFRTGEVFCDEDLVPRDRLLKSVYFTDFLRPARISRICVSVVFGEADEAVPATVLSIYRGLTSIPFGASEQNMLRLLVPHISRSLGTMYRLRSADKQVAASVAVLDRISRGIILFDARGQVTHLNHYAADLLAATDVIRIETTIGGARYLAVADPRKQRQLESMLAGALAVGPVPVAHFNKGLLLPCRDSGFPMVLSLSRLSAANALGSGTDQPSAIGFLNALNAAVCVNFTLLRDAFALTPMECRLVGELCAGRSITEVAQRHDLSPLTLRDQLKTVFAKTGVHRQVDLVRLALSASL